jgi:plasmid stabilization system protein ParE
MNVHILSIARQEVEDASDYYEEQREGLGHEFILAFEKTLDDVQLFPGLGSKIEKDCRRRRFKRFPYGIVYRLHEGDIYVVAVMHLHRKPGYWKRRLKEIE